MKKDLIGTTEAADILGISRIAVFKRIQKGQLEAVKVGRNYVIDRKKLEDIASKHVPGRTGSALRTKPAAESVERKRPEKRVKKEISEAVGKAMKEYGDAIKKMGIE